MDKFLWKFITISTVASQPANKNTSIEGVFMTLYSENSQENGVGRKEIFKWHMNFFDAQEIYEFSSGHNLRWTIFFKMT